MRSWPEGLWGLCMCRGREGGLLELVKSSLAAAGAAAVAVGGWESLRSRSTLEFGGGVAQLLVLREGRGSVSGSRASTEVATAPGPALGPSCGLPG